MAGELRGRAHIWIAVFGLLLVSSTALCDYPRIRELNTRDVLFKQLQSDLRAYFRAQSRFPAEQSAEFPPLRLFSYEPAEDQDLFSIAARLNLPYDCIATLNGVDNPAAFGSVEVILVPNQPGIFMQENPESSFQEVVASISVNTRQEAERMRIEKQGRQQLLRFYRGQGFTAIERAYFLNILFRFPLPFAHLTSGYGTRDNPFTGHSEFHKGVDLAAPLGTEVFAARDGRVSAVATDPIMGNMIILDHEAGYQTIYGHLQKVLVRLNDEVRSGMIIGQVGTSGYSTGPHLHFEVRRGGASRDPAPLLPMPKETSR